MPPKDLQQQINDLQNNLQFLRGEFVRSIQEHEHDGIEATQIKDFNIFGEIASRLNTEGKTVATTGNTDWYIIAPISGQLSEIDFSGTDALATHADNYITFSITNLGRAGAGSTAMLQASDTNTTKATTGTAIAADTVRELLVSNAVNAGSVVKGDRLRIRAAATGTLANTITNSVFTLRFK